MNFGFLLYEEHLRLELGNFRYMPRKGICLLFGEWIAGVSADN